MTYKSAVKILVMAAALLAWLTGVAQADTLADIKAKGVLTVGVKADYPPFSYRAPTGELTGLEVDLAKDIAQRLGVKLQLESVAASNRIQFLRGGKVDLIIATMAVTNDRKKAVGVLEPYYYASSIAVLALKSSGIKSAADLEGKDVCVMKGAYYNGNIIKLTGRALVDVKRIRRLEDIGQAIKSSRCDAFAYEDARLLYKKNLKNGDWKDFEVVTLDFPPLPWAIAVRSEDKNAAWGQYMTGALVDWHKSGLLTKLEAKWLGKIPSGSLSRSGL
ncbi:MAG: transporter substrate-binding domain-containing protein [Alphaproteobacteria bacterium]